MLEPATPLPGPGVPAVPAVPATTGLAPVPEELPGPPALIRPVHAEPRANIHVSDAIAAKRTPRTFGGRLSLPRFERLHEGPPVGLAGGHRQ